MKLYPITLAIIFSFFTFTSAQNSQNNDGSELTKLKTESLQLEMDVDLYPNPTSEYLNISLKNTKLKDVDIEMYNIIGNKLDPQIDKTKSNSYKINVKDLQSGYYLVLVKDPVSRYNKAFKFRKQ